MPRDSRPPDPRTISSGIYLIVLVIAVAIAYVAVRALLG